MVQACNFPIFSSFVCVSCSRQSAVRKPLRRFHSALLHFEKCTDAQFFLKICAANICSFIRTAPEAHAVRFFLRTASRFSFPLGVFFVVLNRICLSFTQIHAHFYINYIIYYGLQIFCCQ